MSGTVYLPSVLQQWRGLYDEGLGKVLSKVKPIMIKVIPIIEENFSKLP